MAEEEIEGFDIDVSEFVPYRGDIYRGKSVKGGWTYIVYLATHTDEHGKKWAVYAINDRGKKIEYATFLKSLEYGDLEFQGNVRDPGVTQRVDVERLSFMAVGLSSLGAGVSAHEHLEALQQEAIQKGGSPLILDEHGKPMQ